MQLYNLLLYCILSSTSENRSDNKGSAEEWNIDVLFGMLNEEYRTGIYGMQIVDRKFQDGANL